MAAPNVATKTKIKNPERKTVEGLAFRKMGKENLSFIPNLTIATKQTSRNISQVASMAENEIPSRSDSISVETAMKAKTTICPLTNPSTIPLLPVLGARIRVSKPYAVIGISMRPACIPFLLHNI
jgi:hypothetical protein